MAERINHIQQTFSLLLFLLRLAVHNISVSSAPSLPLKVQAILYLCLKFRPHLQFLQGEVTELKF